MHDIPTYDDWHIGVVIVETQNAERSRGEREMLCTDRREADPAHGQGSPELPVLEERDVPIQRAQTAKQSICAPGKLRDRFTVRASVTENVPV